MNGKGICLVSLALGLALHVANPARAGDCINILGWHIGRDCPRSDYSPLHYWVPEWYKVRANVHPSNLDQYPAGPGTPVEPSVQIIRYRCRTLPPAPSPPYADPAGYYGRQMVRE